MIEYDANGDVLFAYPESPMMENKEHSLYDQLFPERHIRHIENLGTGNKTFFLPPDRWKTIGGTKDASFFYDSNSIRHYEKFGDKLTEAWLCSAKYGDDYTMMFVTLNHTKRVYEFSDIIIYNYGTHNIKAQSSIPTGETRIRPGTIMEDCANCFEILA